jgi:hypothetical protein
LLQNGSSESEQQFNIWTKKQLLSLYLFGSVLPLEFEPGFSRVEFGMIPEREREYSYELAQQLVL